MAISSTTKKKKSGSTPKRTSKPTPRVNSNHKQTGLYTAPRGNVTIAVPAFWSLRQTNDDLEVESPTGKTSVIVTAFQSDGSSKRLDAREYLQHFMETAQTKSKPKLNGNTRQHARARFRDVDGDNWEVLFLSNGKTLLLATCNSSLPSTGKEAKVGVTVLESLKLKRG
ncbi:MAG TPA: hypothetical protein VEB03_02110 [Candidatus Nanoarchaeia archaeon]|nr:hypothetical protein [Candidatus Nanoarchaeia archaeon]